MKENYVNFEGRASRSEYWNFVLCKYLIVIACFVLIGIAGLTKISALITLFSILSPLVGLALILPSIAAVVRRLHDIGKSGWWLLISLIPIIGAFWLIYLLCQDSQKGENEYGTTARPF